MYTFGLLLVCLVRCYMSSKHDPSGDLAPHVVAYCIKCTKKMQKTGMRPPPVDF